MKNNKEIKMEKGKSERNKKDEIKNDNKNRGREKTR